MIPDVKSMSLDEKMQTMAALWQDMREHVADSAETEEVCELLAERKRRLESGEAKLLDWDSVKASIGRG